MIFKIGCQKLIHMSYINSGMYLHSLRVDLRYFAGKIFFSNPGNLKSTVDITPINWSRNILPGCFFRFFFFFFNVGSCWWSRSPTKESRHSLHSSSSLFSQTFFSTLRWINSLRRLSFLRFSGLLFGLFLGRVIFNNFSY